MAANVWTLQDTQAGYAYITSMNSALVQGTVTQTGTTQFRLTYGSDSMVFKGSFTLDGQGKISGGTISGFDVYHGFTLLAEATGYAIPVAAFVFALIDIQSNPPGPAGGGEQMAALLDGDGRTVNGSLNSDVIYGTNFSDRLLGGGNNDALAGLGGKDELFGGAGNDMIEAGAGSDLLDGGAGADKLAGGSGDDTYIVDNTADELHEEPLQGKDTVQSSVSHKLGDHFENLTLTGSANINGTGNAFFNTLIGNAGDNALSGGDGKDTLSGNAGNDVISGGAMADTIDGGPGIDRATYVEKAQAVEVTLNGATGVAVLVGGLVEDTIRNIENLTGGAGDDRLTGDALANALAGGHRR